MRTLAAAAMLLSACGGDDPPAPAAPWVEVGTGREAFRPLDDGDDLELVFGPQGAWHVDVSVRFGGLSPEGLVLTYRARDDGGNVGYPANFFLQAGDVVALADGGYERLGDRVVMSVTGGEVVGRALSVEAEVVQSGTVLADAHLVTIIDELP